MKRLEKNTVSEFKAPNYLRFILLHTKKKNNEIRSEYLLYIMRVYART